MKYSISRRLISAAAAAALGCSLCTGTVQSLAADSLPAAVSYDSSEFVDVIVKLKGEAVLAAPEACGQGADYIDTDAARAAEDRLRAAQDSAEAYIRCLYPELEIKRRFTLTANGFSCTVPAALIADIESCPLVGSVSEVRTDFAAEPQLSTARELGGISSFCNTTGFTGEGEVIAVIDTEFDVTHDMFAPMTDKEARLGKEDITAISSRAGFSSKLSADKVYLSSKVPFAYDYGDDTPYTLSAEDHYHGTHIGGIAAGNRIKASDGTEISGVAPDAQLLMMKVYGDENGTFTVTDEAVAAAIEDAVKLKADVINMSFGRIYEYYDRLFYADSIAAAVNAGITLCSSAGNNSNDHFGLGNKSTVENVDTGSVTEPSMFPEVMSVASANNSSGFTAESFRQSGNMSKFSSYGVGTSLDLKPDITGIGGNVVSAAYGNGTELMSGTSMASPYIAGCAALCDQLMKAQGSELSGAERQQRIRNILMNSAVPLTDRGSLISPRRQGAGLAALDRAAEDKVIMTGASGKAAVELHDGLGDTFSFELRITNISSEDVVFTGSDIALTTDGFEINIGSSKKSISGQIPLSSQNDLDSEITVPAGTTVTKTVTVSLDAAQVESLRSIFTNGFFTEGFISLTGAENCCDISIPLIGFCGDWCMVPTLDTERYPILPKVSVGTDELRTDISFTRAADMLSSIMKTDPYMFNISPEDPDNFPASAESVLNAEQIGEFYALSDGVSYISPNSDAFGDCFGCYYVPVREAVFTGCDVYDSSGELLCRTKTNEMNSYQSQLALLPEEAYALPDGRYSCRLDSYIEYGDEKKQSYPFGIEIDTSVPEVEYEYAEEDGRKLLRLTAKDNALDGIIVTGVSADEESAESFAGFNALALAQRTLKNERYIASELVGTDKRLSDSCETGQLPAELSDFRKVLTGQIKPDKYYNYCMIIPAEPDADGSFSVTLDITGLGEYTVCVLDRAFNEFDIRPEVPLPDDFKPGIWKAVAEPFAEYYEFHEDGKVIRCLTDQGGSYRGSYKINGDRFLFYHEYSTQPSEAVIKWIDSDNALLYWETYSLPQKLTFMQEGTLSDFSFYSDEVLRYLAGCYYTSVTGSAPTDVFFKYDSETDKVRLTVSELTEEGRRELDVYIIDRETATGTNRAGDQVDLKETAYFSMMGIWYGYTAVDTGGIPRFLFFDENDSVNGIGVYAYQSDGIEHEFECSFNGNTVTFSFDSYDNIGAPSRTATMRMLSPDKIELTWDNGLTERFVFHSETCFIEEIGFLTNDKLTELCREHYFKATGVMPDVADVLYGVEQENTADVMMYTLADDGSTVFLEEYIVDYITGNGWTGGGMHVNIITGSQTAPKLGDVNDDGMIDAKDASLILVAYAKVSTGAEHGLTSGQRAAADVICDDMIDAKDASIVLAYYACLSTSEDNILTLSEFVEKKLFEAKFLS